jgi:nucleotide-binding universal stress UspA family protein
MAIEKILLPYNFTHIDQKAVNFIIESFVHLKDIAITIFNAYTAAPEIETPSTSVTGKLKGSLSYLTQKISDQENELDEVKQKFIQGGFAADKIETVFKPRKKDIASEIMELAMKNQYDVIVLNRKHAKVTRFFSGSVSHKVSMSLKGTTVCIVS